MIKSNYTFLNAGVIMRYLLACLLFFIPQVIKADSIKQPEKGRVEIINRQKVIYLKGSAYEIGYQHGTLLKAEIALNTERFITPLSTNRGKPPIIAYFLEAIPKIMQYIPQELMEEMQGIADASGQSLKTIMLMNLFPEMFHCTGITVKGNASLNGELYHVRVLDYAMGKGLQDTAILAVVEPDEGIPFLNATYAGFVGCVTGMNLQKIAIGEIGGKGYGHWNGVPMAFLLRRILQNASSLAEIKETLASTPRTCEYFYLFSDGKTGDSFGCYATPDFLSFFHPGESYCKYPPLPNTFDIPFISESKESIEVFYPPEDTLMVCRWDNFYLLKDRLLNYFGGINPTSLQEAIKQPIAHPSNLHNAIFAPSTLDLWISHAGPNNEPACNQPYEHFNLITLMKK
jgi:isopenicillin-N N-acyltransferase-like protein